VVVEWSELAAILVGLLEVIGDHLLVFPDELAALAASQSATSRAARTGLP